MARKSIKEPLIDPIQAQIDLLTYISTNDLTKIIELVATINKHYPKEGSLAVKETLLPNQFSVVNESSIYAVQHLKCLRDRHEVLFYQRYYYSLSRKDRQMYYKAMDEMLSLPPKSFTEQTYMDGVKLALAFNDISKTKLIKEKF